MQQPTLPKTVIPVECHYECEQKACALLMIEGGRAAFVDNNTSHAIPYLMQALKDHGLAPEQVDYAIITHVHLDHAGGSAALLECCPNATLIAHPKAARHAIDPTRLVAAAKSVYGEEAFATLYGEIEGVDESRVRVVEDGEELLWGERTLRFIYTLGHASHHICVYDSGTNGIFTGDAFGLGPSPYLRDGPTFLIASSAPTDYDPAEARRSVQKILDTGAEWAYLPHYGIHGDIERSAQVLLRSLDFLEAILNEAAASDMPDPEIDAFCEARLQAAVREHLVWCGVRGVEADLAWMGADTSINAMGVAFLAKRIREKNRQQT